MTKGKATLRFIGSIIWFAGICYMFWLLREVPHGGWYDNEKILRLGNKSDVFFAIGFLGLFQSAAFVKMFLGCVNNGFNTRYDDVYTDSSGREVKREMNADATMGGCFLSMAIGILLMFVISAFASPIVFCYNLYNFIDAWSRETRLAGFFKFIAVVLVVASVVGTYFGGKWLYTQIDEIYRYKEKMHRKQQQTYGLGTLQPNYIAMDINDSEENVMQN